MDTLYHFRKQAGYCVRCGGTAVLPYTQCQFCAERSREYSAAYRARKRATKKAAKQRKAKRDGRRKKGNTRNA